MIGFPGPVKNILVKTILHLQLCKFNPANIKHMKWVFESLTGMLFKPALPILVGCKLFNQTVSGDTSIVLLKYVMSFLRLLHLNDTLTEPKGAYLGVLLSNSHK